MAVVGWFGLVLIGLGVAAALVFVGAMVLMLMCGGLIGCWQALVEAVTRRVRPSSAEVRARSDRETGVLGEAA